MAVPSVFAYSDLGGDSVVWVRTLTSRSVDSVSASSAAHRARLLSPHQSQCEQTQMGPKWNLRTTPPGAPPTQHKGKPYGAPVETFAGFALFTNCKGSIESGRELQMSLFDWFKELQNITCECYQLFRQDAEGNLLWKS